MKVVLFKQYSKSMDVWSYDDYYVENVQMAIADKVLDIESKDFNELVAAINLYNSKPSRFKYIVTEVAEDDDMKELLADYKAYTEKVEQQNKARQEAEIKRKQEDAAKRANAALMRQAKKLGITVEQLKQLQLEAKSKD